jgi:uncharacterized membrane protein YcaP (DUF421 family)
MDIVLRAAVMFIVIYALLRLLGKRELSQMTPFELVVLIVMGDLIQQGVTHNDFSLTGAILAAVTMGFLSLVLAWSTYLFPKLQKYLDGEPRIIVRHGKLLEDNMKRDRISRGELESEMRLAGISHLDKVAWAIIEPQGKISFIRRDDAEPNKAAQDQALSTQRKRAGRPTLFPLSSR